MNNAITTTNCYVTRIIQVLKLWLLLVSYLFFISLAILIMTEKTIPNSITKILLTLHSTLSTLLSSPKTTTYSQYVDSQYVDSHQPYYFTKQLINHEIENENESTNYYTQRYYQSDEYYNYSNKDMSPIFVIIGGEGRIEPTTGLLYPFIYKTLAKKFNAYVIQPEHRFYGTSQPINRSVIDEYRSVSDEYTSFNNLPDPRINILTYEQSLNDIIRLLHNVTNDVLNCAIIPNNEYNDDKKNKNNNNNNNNLPNCGPIIAVGGSYSGFLSAMTRVLHPTIFDISYAASAPIYYYSQQIQSNQYYDHIATVIENYFPSCTKSVYNTMNFIEQYYLYTYPNNRSIDTTGVSLIGVCCDSYQKCAVPSYAITNAQTFINEIIMMIAYTFANANMAFYPPSSTGDNTLLQRACTIFMDDELLAFQKVSQFFISFLGNSSNNEKYNIHNNKQKQQQQQSCFNMIEQVPYGLKGTISSGDWTGVGTGYDGDSWDYQTCTQLIETISLSGSLFPTTRTWTYEWLLNHCSQRFNTVVPSRTYNNDKYQLNELFNSSRSSTSTNNNNNNLSYILFTNGLNDGWSVSGVKDNISDTIISINFPNGAHHSDLNHIGINPMTDTIDITNGYKQIESILSKWINTIIIEKRNNKMNFLNDTSSTSTQHHNRITAPLQEKNGKEKNLNKMKPKKKKKKKYISNNETISII